MNHKDTNIDGYLLGHPIQPCETNSVEATLCQIPVWVELCSSPLFEFHDKKTLHELYLNYKVSFPKGTSNGDLSTVHFKGLMMGTIQASVLIPSPMSQSQPRGPRRSSPCLGQKLPKQAGQWVGQFIQKLARFVSLLEHTFQRGNFPHASPPSSSRSQPPTRPIARHLEVIWSVNQTQTWNRTEPSSIQRRAESG